MTGEPDSAPAPATTPASAATAVPPPVPSRWPRALRPFRHREYRLLTASMAVSLVASGMWAVGLVWQVIALGGGPTDVSIVMTALSAGLLVSVLIGGVAADRLPRRALLITVESIRVGTAVIVGVLAVTALLQVWHLAVIAFVLGAAEAFFFPAYTALLPTILPADELLAANGVEGTLRPAAQSALGPALAGVLIGAFAPSIALLGAGLLYGIALLTLLFMRPLPPPAVSEERSSVAQDLREGFAYLFRTAGCSPPWRSPRCWCSCSSARSRCCCRSRCATRRAVVPAVTRSPSALTASVPWRARSPPRRSPCRAATSRS